MVLRQLLEDNAISISRLGRSSRVVSPQSNPPASGRGFAIGGCHAPATPMRGWRSAFRAFWQVDEAGMRLINAA